MAANVRQTFTPQNRAYTTNTQTDDGPAIIRTCQKDSRSRKGIIQRTEPHPPLRLHLLRVPDPVLHLPQNRRKVGTPHNTTPLPKQPPTNTLFSYQREVQTLLPLRIRRHNRNPRPLQLHRRLPAQNPPLRPLPWPRRRPFTSPRRRAGSIPRRLRPGAPSPAYDRRRDRVRGI